MKKYFQKGRAVWGAALLSLIIGTGCGDSENFVFTPQGPIGNAPVAVNDAFDALGNSTLNRTAPGVLSNDTPNGAQITNFDTVGSNGGSLSLNEDGSLAYTPVFGFVGAETFGYTLTNAVGQSTATITFTSTGRGFFVDNTVSGGGDGSQAQPFNTLVQAVNAAQSGDTIFVARGDGTNNGLSGAINLPNGVDLVGEGTGLILAQTIVPPGQAPVITGPVLCGGDNTVSGLTIRGATGSAIEVEFVGDVVITNNTIGGSSLENIFLTDTTGTVTISDNLFDDPPNTDLDAICAANEDTNGDLVISDNVFTNETNNDIDAIVDVVSIGSSVMNVTIRGNVANGTSPEQFDEGLDVLAADGGTVNVTIADNVVNNIEEHGISLISATPDASVNGTISGNTISNVDDVDGVFVVLNEDDSVTISGNVITDVFDSNVFLVVDGGGTFIVENNQLSGGLEDGVYLEGGNGVGELARIAVRNNTINSTPHSIHLEWLGDGDLCADITGNNVTANIVLDGSGASGDLDVEQLSLLETLNTMNGNIVDATDVNEVAEGACAIP